MTSTSDQHPDNYDASKYPSVFVTVDLAIFTIRNGALCVLLVERGDEPFQGSWALPGGFINPDEDAEQAAWRELAEETGVEQWTGHLEQLKTYSDPKRDPRHRIVSVAHVAIAANLPNPTFGSDAADARWWAVDDLDLDETGADPDAPDLAFDHRQILRDAVERVRNKIEYTTLALQFVEEPFTLGEVHRVFEAILGVPVHKGNFYRKAKEANGFLVDTGKQTSEVAKGQRRAALYKRGSATYLQPPIMRPQAG